MRRQERVAAMERLRTDPSVKVMLISLKAGGQGLNLTAASRIYLMEPYWYSLKLLMNFRNPAVEQQAIDRVHRLGQTKPVQTIRFIAKGSIEENIVALQQEKMRLAQLTFNEDKESKKESLQKQRLADLASLFK
jgi:SNF2 family DNA or RNA helicase